MPNFTLYKLLDACREPGCPVCRVEQQSVERHLESQFYENVNSPRWRDSMRASLGFCHEHAWLAVDHRLGDALGFSIVYQDILNNILRKLDEGTGPLRSSHHWTSVLRRVPEQARIMMEKLLSATTPVKRCPVCDHREDMTRIILSVLVDELERSEMFDALQSSDGLCLPHLQRSLEQVRDVSVCEKLLTVHREKLESLRTELSEFIRKSDYQAAREGFGREGDAWLRTVTLITGSRKGK